jgi:hypothetical protein
MPVWLSPGQTHDFGPFGPRLGHGAFLDSCASAGSGTRLRRISEPEEWTPFARVSQARGLTSRRLQSPAASFRKKKSEEDKKADELLRSVLGDDCGPPLPHEYR